MMILLPTIIALRTLEPASSPAWPQLDAITQVPGFPDSLPSQHFSGFIDTSSQHHFHYYLALSEDVDPLSAPTIISLSGGPGCASMMRVFIEQGPFRLFPNGSEADAGITVGLNPHRWTRLANVVFVEAPLGVGFSYSSGGDGYDTNDNITAANNHAFVRGFLEKYPLLRKNPMYISGESYAGIYVPTLAQLVVRDPELAPQLQGVLVGNGVTKKSLEFDPFQDFLPFIANHGIISDSVYANLSANCPCASCPNGTEPTAACAELWDNVWARFDNIDMYNIYSPCATTVYDRRVFRPEAPPNGGPVPCISSTLMHKYLNLAEVREAFHVTESPNTWFICSDINYTSTIDNVVPIYRELMAANVTALVFSGMQDASVPYVGTERWVTEMGLKPLNASNLWRPWHFMDAQYGKQTAGYVSEYVGGFTFATVLRAGHMVPWDAPLEAYNMFSRTLAKTPL